VDSGFGDNKTTVWLDCTLWGDRGEKLAPMILKGDRIGVTGELGTREHDGKTYVTLKVADVTLLGNKKPDQESRPARSESLPPPADDFGDIPFD
jgi:single-strand DNA-binding protein